MCKKNNMLKAVLVVIFCVGIASCGYQQINTQKRDVAYLKFTKSATQRYTVLINEKFRFELGSCEKKQNGQKGCQDPTRNKLYEVTSGNVLLEVTDDRSGKLIMRKKMYLGSSNTTEIALP